MKYHVKKPTFYNLVNSTMKLLRKTIFYESWFRKGITYIQQLISLMKDIN